MENLGFIAALLCIFLCLLNVSGIVSVWEELKPEDGYSGMVARNYILKTFSYRLSLPSCYNACLAILSCMSFFHNRASENCQLQLNVFLKNRTLAASTGFEYYILNGGPQCSRKDGFFMNRQLGVCFTVIEVVPDTTIEAKRSICTSVNSRIMSLESPEKEAMMKSVTRTGAALPGADSIGLTRADTLPATWIWETGKTLTWSNWYPGEPTISSLSLCVYAATTGWDDYRCTYEKSHHMVCEKF